MSETSTDSNILPTGMTLAPKPECYWTICKMIDEFIKTKRANDSFHLIELLKESLNAFEQDLNARQAMN
jgi:hypothetical protein